MVLISGSVGLHLPTQFRTSSRDIFDQEAQPGPRGRRSLSLSLRRSFSTSSEGSVSSEVSGNETVAVSGEPGLWSEELGSNPQGTRAPSDLEVEPSAKGAKNGRSLSP